MVSKVRSCAVDGCIKSMKTTGRFCHTHHHWYYRYGTTIGVTRVCECGCGESFETSPGSQKRCINRNHTQRKWAKKITSEQIRAWGLRSQYGLEVTEYEEILEAQGGGCAICGQSEQLQVDHDHVTGRVRGILCAGCNRGLGQFGDDLGKLAVAIIYLESAKTKCR